MDRKVRWNQTVSRSRDCKENVKHEACNVYFSLVEYLLRISRLLWLIIIGWACCANRIGKNILISDF